MSAPELIAHPKPSVWFHGPDPDASDRKVRSWVKQTAAHLNSALAGAGSKQARAFVIDRLERLAARPALLPYRIIRWRNLGELPLVAEFALIERTELGDDPTAFLDPRDPEATSTPVLTALPEPAEAGDRDVTITRSVTRIGAGLASRFEVRYIIDVGDRDLLAAVRAVADSQTVFETCLADLDAFARTLDITRA